MVNFKRKILYILLAIILVIAILWSSLLLLSSGEIRSAKFANYAALERSDSWQRGWIPAFVPKEAKNIYEKHDLDTNAVYGEFSAPSFSPERAGLRKLTDAEKAHLVDALPWGVLRLQVAQHQVFGWCKSAEKMAVHLYVNASGRATYWGNSDRVCSTN
jgi:hypothetical protein